MARYRSMGLRPVNRIKHVVDSNANLASGIGLDIPLVNAVDDPVLANVTEVITGSKVNGIYLKVEISSNQMVPNAVINAYMYVGKNPGENLVMPPANTVGSNDNKRFVIHQEMVMLQNEDGGNPRTLFNGVIAIPRGYRRMGPKDQLFVKILCPNADTTVCIQCHYKEFR